jgi:hypothetical protein
MMEITRDALARQGEFTTIRERLIKIGARVIERIARRSLLSTFEAIRTTIEALGVIHQPATPTLKGGKHR